MFNNLRTNQTTIYIEFTILVQNKDTKKVPFICHGISKYILSHRLYDYEIFYVIIGITLQLEELYENN